MGKTAVRVFAHRGGSGGRFPENSIPAFLDGMGAGADVLELDVRLSRDGRVVVLHDPTIDRVSTGRGGVAQLGAAEIRSFPLRDGFGHVHDDARVPVLEEVLESCPGIPVNIDLKSPDPELSRKVLAILDEHDARHRVTVASFHSDALLFFRTIAPGVETACTPDEIRGLLRSWLRRDAADAAGRRVQIPLRRGLIPLTTRPFIRYLHANGYAVDVWTVNRSSTALGLLQRGVDGIITDDVRLIKEIMGSTE